MILSPLNQILLSGGSLISPPSEYRTNVMPGRAHRAGLQSVAAKKSFGGKAWYLLHLHLREGLVDDLSVEMRDLCPVLLHGFPGVISGTERIKPVQS